MKSDITNVLPISLCRAESRDVNAKFQIHVSWRKALVHASQWLEC